jgi:hypothetical protein
MTFKQYLHLYLCYKVKQKTKRHKSGNLSPLYYLILLIPLGFCNAYIPTLAVPYYIIKQYNTGEATTRRENDFIFLYIYFYVFYPLGASSI